MSITQGRQIKKLEDPQGLLDAQKPHSMRVIVECFVDTALHSEDPISELRALRSDQRFAYRPAQLEILKALLKTERRGFEELERTGVFSRDLLASFSISGSLIKEALSKIEGFGCCKTPGEKDENSAVVNTSLHALGRAEWSQLMVNELQFLASCEFWTDDHLHMLCHTCNVAESLASDSATNSGTDPIAALCIAEFLSSLQTILQSQRFVTLFDRYEDDVVVDCLYSVASLSFALGDRVLTEEVISFCPVIHSICTLLSPHEYSVSNEDFEFDEYAEDDLDEVVEDESDEPSFEFLSHYSEPFEAMMEEGSYILSEKWGALLKFYLSKAGINGAQHHARMLLEILRESPFEMPSFAVALDALVCASLEHIEEFVPELLKRSLEDQLGIVYVLSLVEFQERCKRPDVQNPLPILAAAMKSLQRDERRLILEGAEDLQTTCPDLLEELGVSQQALKKLNKEVHRRSR